MSKPLISILMPAYNCELYVKRAISCILNQSYFNLELLISDDGSTDCTRKIIDAFPDDRIKRFHNEYNMGYLKTCNKLFEKCTGEYIAFQDADDWSAKDRIEKQYNYMKEHSVKISTTGFNKVTEEGSNIESWLPPVNHRELLLEANINKTIKVCGASIMISSLVYKDIGGYRVFFDGIGAEHYDWLYLIIEKYKINNIPEALYFYRDLPNSFSKTIDFSNPIKLIATKLSFSLYRQRVESGGKDCVFLNDLSAQSKLINELFSSVNIKGRFVNQVIACRRRNEVKVAMKHIFDFYSVNKFKLESWPHIVFAFLFVVIGEPLYIVISYIKRSISKFFS